LWVEFSAAKRAEVVAAEPGLDTLRVEVMSLIASQRSDHVVIGEFTQAHSALRVVLMLTLVEEGGERFEDG